MQRVMLALAMMSKPDLLILDEPISGIDKNGKEQFYSVQYMDENDQATIWLVFDQKPFFKHFQKNKPFADDQYPHIAVTSKDFVDYTAKLAQWRKTAAEKNLQLPELPDFLQGM